MEGSAVIYSYNELKQLTATDFSEKLSYFIQDKGLPVEESQRVSWGDCYRFLMIHLQPFNIREDLKFVFEYFLPFEGGRRPDVIVLTDQEVLILEFKRKGKILLKDQEQAIHYRQDIANYHHVTNDLNLSVSSYLVYTSEIHETEERLIPILSPDNFKEFIRDHLEGKSPLASPLFDQWVNSRYEPLLSIVQASKKIFTTGDLPQIKRIEEGDIQGAMNIIDRIVQSQQLDKTLIFVNGVPGSGKTLVGIKTVYDYLDQGLSPIYLSGNGPLINVLQGLLSEMPNREGRIAIKSMHAFKYEYNNSNREVPHQYIVFDEAQRAWDEEKMKSTKSEADVLLDIGDRVAQSQSKVTIVCLIGDGQAIHTGEEKGMSLWKDALNTHPDWNVVGANSIESICNIQYERKSLYLNTSIRNNFINVYPWVEAILNADTGEAKHQLADIAKQGFKVRLVRDPQLLPGIVTKLKARNPDDHTGLFISSKVNETMQKQLFTWKFKGSYITPKDAYQWYMKDSYRLNSAASEFLCQGLESEWPIVCFGGDYYLENNQWKIDEATRKKHQGNFENFETIIQNIYRVLLTRSRYGLFLYLPKVKQLDELAEFFKLIGIDEIEATGSKI